MPIRPNYDITPAVKWGLKLCKISLLRATNYEEKKEKNIVNNWTELFKSLQDPFIGMDDDIVLSPDILRELIQEVTNHDMIYFTQDRNDHCHGLWACKYDVIKKIPMQYHSYLDETGGCHFCNWMQDLYKNKIDVFKCNSTVDIIKK